MKRALPALLLLASLATRAVADDSTPVTLTAGESRELCTTGLAMCPVSSSICDDPKVALVENGPNGPVLRAVSPGTTLCAVLGGATAFRRLLRVKVEPAAPAQPDPAPARKGPERRRG